MNKRLDKQIRIEASQRAEEFSGKWFLCYTKSNCEEKARRRLPFRCLLPLMQLISRKMDHGELKQVVKLVPKFPSYLYVQHDGSSDFFETALSYPEVLYFVGMEPNRLPLPVDAPQIEEMLTTQQEKTILRPGITVTVVEGAFVKLTGVVVEVCQDDEKPFSRVEFQIFGQKVVEEIPNQFLISETGT